MINPQVSYFNADGTPTDEGLKFFNTFMGDGRFSGSGGPESVITAPIGSIYSRLDGGASTSLYIKESGTGNTGWIAK